MISSVQAFAFGQPLGDLRMAIQALEGGRPEASLWQLAQLLVPFKD